MTTAGFLLHFYAIFTLPPSPPPDRSGSEDGRSIEAFEIEEHPDPDSSQGVDLAQNHHSFQHNRFKGKIKTVKIVRCVIAIIDVSVI